MKIFLSLLFLCIIGFQVKSQNSSVPVLIKTKEGDKIIKPQRLYFVDESVTDTIRVRIIMTLTFKEKDVIHAKVLHIQKAEMDEMNFLDRKIKSKKECVYSYFYADTVTNELVKKYVKKMEYFFMHQPYHKMAYSPQNQRVGYLYFFYIVPPPDRKKE